MPAEHRALPVSLPAPPAVPGLCSPLSRTGSDFSASWQRYASADLRDFGGRRRSPELQSVRGRNRQLCARVALCSQYQLARFGRDSVLWGWFASAALAGV
ncbi:unnamed protein product [Coccothraustes coccothraustes]